MDKLIKGESFSRMHNAAATGWVASQELFNPEMGFHRGTSRLLVWQRQRASRCVQMTCKFCLCDPLLQVAELHLEENVTHPALFWDQAVSFHADQTSELKHLLGNPESSAGSIFPLWLMDFAAHRAILSTRSIKGSLPGTSVSNPRCKLDPLEDTRLASH